MPSAFESLLHDFATARGLPAQQILLTQEVIVDEIPVNLLYEGLEDIGDLVLYTNLGMPQPGSEALTHRSLLQANHLWAATGGGTLGLLKDGSVTFCYRTPLNLLSADTLGDTLGLFASHAQNWMSVLSSAPALDELAAV